MATPQIAKKIIEEVAYAAVATVSENGEPWNAPVFVAYDEQYNFYWGTYINSQKSINIRTNNNVFLALYNSTAPAGKGEGVYIRAIATQLSNLKEIKFAHKLLCDRHVVPYWALEQVQGDAPIRLYKATPIKIWMNSEGKENDHYIDTRTEIKL